VVRLVGAAAPTSDIDLLIEKPVRFIPRAGPDAEWPAVEEWVDADWEQWLLQHNNYPFLKHWTAEEISQYLLVDRFRYGVGFGKQPGKFDQWFYQPTPVAVPYHSSKTPNLLFGGAAGGSKSYSARWDALRHAFAIPEFRCIIMRRTFEELERNHIDDVRGEVARMQEYFGRKVIEYVQGRHEIIIDVHGAGRESKILFGHCQNVGDEEKYLGPHYDAFYPDEMATFEQKQIIGIAGRLRTKKRGLVPRLAGTSNPGGAHTLWLKDYFIDKLEAKIHEQNPKYRAERYHFIQAMLWDNPYYMDPDGTYTNYEERLFAYDPERRRQLLLGDWSALAGQFFPEFTPARHVAALDIPPGCKIERWVDWGYDPHYGMCLWVACLPNGRLFVFYEYKFNGATAREKLVASLVADRIYRLTNQDVLPLVKANRITSSIGDPSMWNADGHSGEDYAETFSHHGVHLLKADNSRTLGWGRLRHWFQLAPDGRPWMMFHPRCETTIRTIPSLIRDKKDPDDVDTTCEDHPADCLRYGAMARPTPTHLRQPLVEILPGSIKELLDTLQPATVRGMGMVS
jgi:phage terminase large subunit